MEGKWIIRVYLHLFWKWRERFAASGAMVGAQRGMDIFGICVLGVVTAVGGGATRDIILGIVPPGMFQNPIYTIVATVTSCIVFAIMYWKQELLEGENRMVYDKIMLVMDSVGLGVFTVMGVDKGITEGYMGRTFGRRAAVYFCASYLCLRIHCRSHCLRVGIPSVGRRPCYGDRNCGGDTGPVSGGSLPVEPAEAS